MTIKATRRLTDISFETEGCAVALVGPHQGSAANGHKTLITKATDSISKEVIKAAHTVTVTMTFPEFLRKFFGMYWDDAEVLSAALGHGRTESPDVNAKDYIDQRVESIHIMKSVYRAQDVEKALSELTPEQIVSLRKDQEMLEKALEQVPEINIKSIQEESTLETILKSAHEEFVTKAVADAVAVEKAAFAAQELVLKAAQDRLSEYEAAAQAAVEKSRKEALKGAAIADEKVEELMKSLAPLSAEAFDAVVATFMVQKAAAADSEMFVEKGVAGAGELDQKEVDRTAAILKARYTK